MNWFSIAVSHVKNGAQCPRIDDQPVQFHFEAPLNGMAAAGFYTEDPPNGMADAHF